MAPRFSDRDEIRRRLRRRARRDDPAFDEPLSEGWDTAELLLDDARQRAHAAIEEAVERARDLLQEHSSIARLERVAEDTRRQFDRLRREVGEIGREVRAVHDRLDDIEGLLLELTDEDDASSRDYEPEERWDPPRYRPPRRARGGESTLPPPGGAPPRQAGGRRAPASPPPAPAQPASAQPAPAQPASPQPEPAHAEPPPRWEAGRWEPQPYVEPPPSPARPPAPPSATPPPSPAMPAEQPPEAGYPRTAVPPSAPPTPSAPPPSAVPPTPRAAPPPAEPPPAAPRFEPARGDVQQPGPSTAASVNGVARGERFAVEGGAVVIRVSPVAGFQGLMRIQEALTRVPGVREAGVEAYAQGEARLRLHLSDDLDAPTIAAQLGRSLGVDARVDVASAAERTLRVVLG